MKRNKRWMLTAVLFLCCCLTSFAGDDVGEQFSIATLNVDGLPQKILMLKINADGPGNAGTARIGKYLVKQDYDLVMMQEDFNYHDVLAVWMEDNYKLDEWSGNVGIEGQKIDLLHLQNHRFACDGLMACWKNDLQVTPAARTPWKQNFGKFSHANDEMVTKGFRRYDVTLKGGTRLVVYNMHMDATLDEDEAENKAGKDHDARMAQWAQLKEDVLEQLGTLPIVIVGDMNSIYGRDEVKQEFIDAINESGRGQVADVWVELVQKGVYPGTTTEATAGEETLDKILYINPVTGTKIQPVSITIDRQGYLHEGKALGDHWPVAATFKVVTDGTVGIGATQHENTATSDEKLYDLNGRQVNEPRSGLYIGKNGEKADKRIIK